MEKIINFFKKNILTRIIGIAIGVFFFVFVIVVFLLLQIYASLKIDFTNTVNDNLIKTIGLTSGIISLVSMVIDTNSSNIKEIQKQNEELKEELAEIKNMIAEQPKRYSVEIREIKD